MTTTRSSHHVRATRSEVYAALLDASAFAAWRVPDRMKCKVHTFEPREGGAYRVSLTYDAPEANGKTEGRTATYSGRFTRLVPGETVVESTEFESADPALRGVMTITWTLTDAGTGADLVVVHEGLPPAIVPADNELGYRQALTKLAAFVEGKAQGTRTGILDYTGIGVADVSRSAAFYDAALSALGLRRVAQLPSETGADAIAYGLDVPVFWIDRFHPHGVKQHTAFSAKSRAEVDAFYAAALAAGGTGNGPPGLRDNPRGYPAGYYAAFAIDPDGNNVEAVLREGRFAAT